MGSKVPQPQPDKGRLFESRNEPLPTKIMEQADSTRGYNGPPNSQAKPVPPPPPPPPKKK